MRLASKGETLCELAWDVRAASGEMASAMDRMNAPIDAMKYRRLIQPPKQSADPLFWSNDERFSSGVFQGNTLQW